MQESLQRRTRPLMLIIGGETSTGIQIEGMVIGENPGMGEASQGMVGLWDVGIVASQVT